MSVYGSDLRDAGASIGAGLKAIAVAIERLAVAQLASGQATASDIAYRADAAKKSLGLGN